MRTQDEAITGFSRNLTLDFHHQLRLCEKVKFLKRVTSTVYSLEVANWDCVAFVKKNGSKANTICKTSVATQIDRRILLPPGGYLVGWCGGWTCRGVICKVLHRIHASGSVSWSDVAFFAGFRVGVGVLASPNRHVRVQCLSTEWLCVLYLPARGWQM